MAPAINFEKEHLQTRLLGIKEFNNITLKELLPYFDWSPFFWAWEIKGQYPQILENEKTREQAHSFTKTPKKDWMKLLMLKLLKLGLTAFWKAHSINNTVYIEDENGKQLSSSLSFVSKTVM